MLALPLVCAVGCFSTPNSSSDTDAETGVATGDSGMPSGGSEGNADTTAATTNESDTDAPGTTGVADDDTGTGDPGDDSGTDEDDSTGTAPAQCGDGNADPGEFCIAETLELAVPFTPVRLVTDDMDGNGFMDLVYANDSQMQVSLGNGAGDFAPGSGGPINVREMTLGYFDGDDDPDIAFLDTAAELHFIINDGNGTIQTGTPAYAIIGGTTLAAGDLNNDGHDDVLTVGNGSSATVARSDSDGSGGTTITTIDGIGGSGIRSGVVVAEFNGNTSHDFAFTDILNGGQVVACLGNGSGGPTSCTNHPVGTLPFGIAAGDIDGDGNVDLVSADSGSNGITWLRGQGNGGFDAGLTFETSSSAQYVAVADLNLDGYDDVAIALRSTATLDVRLFDPDTGTLGEPHAFVVGVGEFSEVVAGDFNGDGALDVAVGNGAASTISVFLSDA